MKTLEKIEIIGSDGDIVTTIHKACEPDIWELNTEHEENVKALKVEETKKGVWVRMTLFGLFQRKRFFVSNANIRKHYTE